GKITAAKIAKIFQTFPDISTGIGRWYQSDHKYSGLSAACTPKKKVPKDFILPALFKKTD
ncbi:hypothetical protein KSZ57_20470, partial [Odoribacter splanchnicus]|uniref:hypothetical protein n=1 Tax=Odoribacter splanchnicus TaxID=28118 RepID=UPI001C385A2E